VQARGVDRPKGARTRRPLADPDTGLAADVNAVGRPWQEPDEATESLGRTDLHAAIDSEGRRHRHPKRSRQCLRRLGVDREKVHELAARPLSASTPNVAAALRSAERDPAGCSDDEYLRWQPLMVLLWMPLRRWLIHSARMWWATNVTFVVNRNINFTNICYTGCRFCAFAQRKGDADAYSLSTAEVAERAWEAHVAGATEVCMQGASTPNYR